MNKKLSLLGLVVALLAGNAFAQKDDDLLSLLGEEKTTDYATASFKTNRVIDGHSLESTAAGVLDVKISHRFGPVRHGSYDFFGIDGPALIRIGLDYGITNRLTVGIGRNNKEKLYDGFVKYKIFRQSSGKVNMPITLCYLIDAQVKTEKFEVPDRDNRFSDRLYYAHQILLGRKFSDAFTLQLMPTLVHRNLTLTPTDKNDVYAMGIAGRIKLSKRIAFNAEYYFVPDNQVELADGKLHNTLSLGLDIETGGHVFQLHFTNSPDMSYKGFITETTSPWLPSGGEESGVRFGFNVSRVFTIVKPKAF